MLHIYIYDISSLRVKTDRHYFNSSRAIRLDMSFDVTCDRRKLAGWTCKIQNTLNSLACTLSYRNSLSLMSVVQVNRHGIDFDKSGAKLRGTLHFRRHIEGLGLTFQLIMFTVFWNVTPYMLDASGNGSETPRKF